jgi:hypothetical protein
MRAANGIVLILIPFSIFQLWAGRRPISKSCT